MKIALIIDTWFPHIGGGQINAWEISKRIASSGNQVDIITRNGGPDNLKLPKNLQIYKLGQKSKPYDSMSKIVFLFKSFKFVFANDYDIVHAQAFLPGITARLLSVIKGIPSVFTVHGTSIGTGLNNPLMAWLEKFILTTINYTTQITVSRDFLRIPNVNKKIHYISNGVDIQDFDKVKIAKYKNPTLIFVGRLHYEKNLENLLKSVSIAKAEIPNLKLLIIGSGPEEQKLKKLTSRLNLGNSVTFLGSVAGSGLIKLYKSSHIFILPSIYEGEPLTLLEAWAAKIPAIVTATGDCPYLVKDGINGYLIKNPKDPDQIASQVKKAFDAKNLEDLGENGYNLVAKSFSWEKSAQKTLEVYESLTKAKN